VNARVLRPAWAMQSACPRGLEVAPRAGVSESRARLLRHRVKRRTNGASGSHEPREAAVSAGLRYVTDSQPGIRRQRSGKGFRYVTPGGATLRDEAAIRRIRSLVIPPAWEEVWICSDARGHLQATGRDARGRKQHRYHPRWRKVRDEAKYDRILDFAAALPGLRKRVQADVATTGLTRRRVVATIVQLLEKTLIRVGNEEYARDNDSYGLTTLRGQHARITGSTIRFRFKGKSGKTHDVALTDAKLARIVRRCQELPGRELFQYLDEDGTVQDIGSADVNDYLREVTGEDFTAKDFRTWIGTVLAAHALQEMAEFTSDTQAKRNVLSAIEAVAGMLGNTRSVCRKCYVHPAIIDSYMDRTLADALSRRAASRLAQESLGRTETAVLALLQRRLRRDAQRKSA
jgi:DNA topoisomerase-1